MTRAVISRADQAFTDRKRFETVWQDAYDFAMPGREGFFGRIDPASKMQRVFDETAIVALQEFGAMLAQGLVSNLGDWFRLEPGSDVQAGDRQKVQAQLDEVTAYLHEILQEGTFYQEVHELCLELAMGTGAMFIDFVQGGLIFKSCALPQVAMSVGPFGLIDKIYRRRNMTASDVVVLYPKTASPQVRDAAKDASRSGVGGEAAPQVMLIEASERNYSKPGVEAWDYYVIEHATGKQLVKTFSEGPGSGAWMTPRWTTASDEIYGRGPLLNALPAIKVLNLTVQLILENAELAIEGIWQSDDDGVVNVDTIRLLAGTIIPRAPGSRGLEPLESPTDFGVSQLVLEDMRTNVRKALFNLEFAPLGKTPLSATEAAIREGKLAELIGPAYGRIQQELILPLIRRVVFLFRREGLLEMPSVNGTLIKVVARTPMMRGFKAQHITRLTNFVSTVAQLAGEQVWNEISMKRFTGILHTLYEADPELLVTPEETMQKQQQEAMMAMAQSGALSGMTEAPPAMLP